MNLKDFYRKMEGYENDSSGIIKGLVETGKFIEADLENYKFIKLLNGYTIIFPDGKTINQFTFDYDRIANNIIKHNKESITKTIVKDIINKNNYPVDFNLYLYNDTYNIEFSKKIEMFTIEGYFVSILKHEVDYDGYDEFIASNEDSYFDEISLYLTIKGSEFNSPETLEKIENDIINISKITLKDLIKK